jgi:hypothetical protein
MLTATVEKVKFGCFEIEGLMDEEGGYYVAIPQLVDIKLIPPNRSAKQLQDLTDKAFQTHELVKLKTKLHPKAVNALSIVKFEALLFNLSLRGNAKAIELSRALIGLSLQQLFSDAFKQKFEQEERQQFLAVRLSGKAARRQLTDSINDYIAKHPELSENKAKWLYKNTTDRLYKLLFGKIKKVLAEELKLEELESFRDHLTVVQLRHLEALEDLMTRLIDHFDIYPLEAAEEAGRRYLIK